MTLDDLIKRLKRIKEMGFVPTHRTHDTGIGKTLEDLLEIPENNFRLPDVGEIELKAKRVDSQSMLTIATKSPEPKGVNRVLFDKLKYQDSFGHYCLHTTVCGSRFNNQGLKISPVDKILRLQNKASIEAYWPMSTFDDVLVSKSNKILLVFAETTGERKTISEKFHYIEAYMLSNLNINKFASAIQNDKLKVDIRIGVYRSGKSVGKYHDHGTGFRIDKRNFLELFDAYDQLI